MHQSILWFKYQINNHGFRFSIIFPVFITTLSLLHSTAQPNKIGYKKLWFKVFLRSIFYVLIICRNYWFQPPLRDNNSLYWTEENLKQFGKFIFHLCTVWILNHFISKETLQLSILCRIWMVVLFVIRHLVCHTTYASNIIMKISFLKKTFCIRWN